MRAKNFGERLKSRRRSRMISPEKMANKLGIPLWLYLEIEENIANPSIRVLRESREILGVSTDWLIGVKRMRAKNFGERLKSRRRNRMISPEKMANKLGIPLWLYLEIEENIANPSIRVLREASEILGVSTDWLIRGEENDGLGGENRKTAAQTQKEK